MAGPGDPAKPISLFYSYSHKDEDLRLKLETHLSALRRGGLIAEWHDRKLEPGDAWQREIDRHLTSADIVLLLVSADFIASDYCWGEEMTKALARHGRGEARVIPVILRHCDWRSTPMAVLQAVPRDARPIKSWPDEDEAFLDVVAAIERSVRAAKQRAEEALSKRSRPERVAPRPEARDRQVPPIAPTDVDNFLSQLIEKDTVTTYTAWKYPNLPINEKIHDLLIRDLNGSRFLTLRDVESAIEAATDAVECYRKENPAVFKSGVDFVTKSLGFVDKEFREKHPFSRSTREAFVQYEHLVRREREREKTQADEDIYTPPDEVEVGPVPGRDPERPGPSLWRQPIIIAAIVGAVGAVVAAISPWLLERIADWRSPARYVEEMSGETRYPDPLGETPYRSPPGDALAFPGSPPAASVAATAKQSWRDCEQCPSMVSLSGGTFTMGSPEGEEGRSNDEEPQREVAVSPFAIGQYEVTFAEWDACVGDGGCSQKPGDNGWGRGTRPVIDVSWNDAQEYVKWLKEKTGEPYRLPSEAEWEYAVRAATTTPFALPAPDGSDDIAGQGLANCDGCGSEWDNRQTAPVGSFAANLWGLHDMHGNVWEWVEDCWNESYEGAPTDGVAWHEGNCSMRVTRGGSWDNHPADIRSADRGSKAPGSSYRSRGFRVARAPAP